METVYIRVKAEDELPKEFGNYYVTIKEQGLVTTPKTSLTINPDNPHSIDYFFDTVDIWLKEVPITDLLPKWISVEDSLPILHESVLIFKPSGFPPEDKVYVGWLSENNKWCEEDGPDGISFPNEVTHWMPLPEPPVQQLNEK